MAQFGIQGAWKSVFALASLLTLYGLMGYATYMHTTGPWHELTPSVQEAAVGLGVVLYVVATIALVLGFWSKEDTVAVGAIIGFALLVTMDILLRIGVLGFNGVRVIGGTGGH
jgi:hypothetical protein